MKCDNCTEKCPQEELCREIANGRKYATDEIIRLQKEMDALKAENAQLHCESQSERAFLVERDAEVRSKAIDEAIEASAKAICVGCGYLDGYKCTYKGSNCGVSKPMLESVVKALEKMKGGA